MDKMREFAAALSKDAKTLVTEPVIALGLGLVSKLPMFNSTATVSYRFTDNVNAASFNNGYPNYSAYNFKEGQNITTDYTIVKTIPKEVNLCMWNNSQFVGNDVMIKVGAFIVTSRLQTDDAYTSN